MGRTGPVEMNALKGGTDARGVVPGPYVQNMVYYQGAWRVRSGFGQVVQLDTTSSMPTGTAADKIGYVKHLGSGLIKTNFGHDQVVSVFTAKLRVGSSKADAYANHRVVDGYKSVYVIRIYDLSTGDDWEEILHVHTGELDDEVTPLYDQHGTYGTDITYDYQRWVPANSATECWFVEMFDVLYFGNAQLGALAYFPSVLHGHARSNDGQIQRRRRQLNSDWMGHYGWGGLGYEESSLIVRVSATDGIHAEGFQYLTKTLFPRPTAATAMNGRLVLASGRRIYFSDEGQPTAIIGNNELVIPSEQDITALHEINGNLYIFTQDETWFFQPPFDVIMTSGRAPIKLSDGVGCVGPSAVTKADNMLVWADSNGIFASAGAMSVKPISEELAPYFTSSAGNPISAYWARDSQPGYTGLTKVQPDSTRRFDDDRVTVVWSQRLEAVLICVPRDNTILCYAQGQWSFWTTEAEIDTSGGAGIVGVQANLPNPWLVADDDNVYMVAGIEDQTFADEVTDGGTGGSQPENDTLSSSYIIARYGRGGACDRSVEDEDKRRGSGFYELVYIGTANTTTQGAFRLGEPIWLGERFTFPNAGAADITTFLIPVYYRPPLNSNNANLDAYRLHFKFDETKYSPVLRGATTVDAIFPPERYSSIAGYGATFDFGAGKEIRVYSGVTPDGAGNEIRIGWDGTALSGWTTAPLLNMVPGAENLLMYLPFTTSQVDTTLGMGVTRTDTHASPSGETDRTPALYVWKEHDVIDEEIEDDSKAQPVTWAYLSGPIRMGDGGQARLRTVFSKMMSHGKATTRLLSDHTDGLFNMNIWSDQRGWSAQLLDYAGKGGVDYVERVADRETLIPRFFGDSAAVAGLAPNDVTFAGDLFTGGRGMWGSTNEATNATIDGKVLIGDEPVADIAISQQVKGEWFRVMLYGHMGAHGEALALHEVRVTMKPWGGRKRWARAGNPTDGGGA